MAQIVFTVQQDCELVVCNTSLMDPAAVIRVVSRRNSSISGPSSLTGSPLRRESSEWDSVLRNISN